MKQWFWLLESLLFLSFHALFEPMVTILMLGSEPALEAKLIAKAWRTARFVEDWAVEYPFGEKVDDSHGEKDEEIGNVGCLGHGH